jgi:hypoxanthine phosphoribosyltransferase
VSLLSKPSRRRVPVNVEYVGFEIEDRFVVGYGMDYGERYRNLPHIAVFPPEPGSADPAIERHS